ncbi:MAG: 2Fe-2S iron-sulfur cluster binding domain-containing protein [Rhodoblastus sp.]|nr:MAG: 2Fe-2S iron-sulfur cluster binding domain-containing protein [Rhodoblastus sp.]
MHLRVVDHAGASHMLEALDGWRAMEVIRDWGVGIKAECGGACACGGCHVYIDPAWTQRLHPPSDEEIERLDECYGVEANSRLCCQILMTPDLDGLTLTLAPGSEPE